MRLTKNIVNCRSLLMCEMWLACQKGGSMAAGFDGAK